MSNRDFVILLYNQIIASPLKIVIICFLLTFILSLGMFHTKFTNSHKVFFDQGNPHLKSLTMLEDNYGPGLNVLFCLIPEHNNVFSQEILQVIKTLEDSLRNYQEVTSIASIISAKKVTMGFAGPQLKSIIPQKKDFSTLDSAAIAHAILQDSTLVNRLISPSGHATGVNANITFKEKSELNNFSQSMYGLAQTIQNQYPSCAIYVTGGVMIDAAFFTASFRDAITLIPLMYMLVFLAIWIITGSIFAVICVFCTVLFSTLIAMGFSSWLGVILSPPSSIAPIIILTVGIADSIHLLVAFSHHRRQDDDKKQALFHALKKTFTPITVTSITSIIGFLSLNFSEVPPFRDMGNIVALGITATYLFTILLLPALLILLSDKMATHHQALHDIFGLKLGSLVTSYHKSLLVLIILLGIGSFMGIQKIGFNDIFIDYFKPRYQFRKDTDIIIKNLTGLDYIECSLPVSDSLSLEDSIYIGVIDTFTQWVKKQPGVKHTMSMSVVLKKAAQDLSGNNPSKYRLPKKKLIKAMVKKYRKFQEKKQGLPVLINKEGSATRILVTVGSISASELRDLAAKIKDWFKNYSSAPSTYNPVIGSTSLIFAYLSERNIKSMIRGIGLSLVIITVIIILLGKSLRIGTLSIIPNLFPALMAFGVWGFLYTQAGLGTSIVSAMTLGIIVDDTIHFLFTFKHGLRKGLQAKQAVLYAFRHVTDAILFTSIILIAGFSVLLFSGFKPTSEMGLLTAMIIFFALVTDLFLFPPLLILFYAPKKFFSW